MASRLEPPGTPARSRLTGAGATCASLGGTLLAAALDAALGPALGWLFGVLFVPLCLWVSARVRAASLFTAAVLPPLAFFLAVLMAVLLGEGWGGALPVLGAVVAGLGAGWPILATATVAGTGLAVLRRFLPGAASGRPGRPVSDCSLERTGPGGVPAAAQR